MRQKLKKSLGSVRRSVSLLSEESPETPDLYALLFQSGYLTIKGYDKATREFILGFPNREVTHAFWQGLYRYFISPYTSDNALSAQHFAEDLESGNVDGFMTRLQSIL